MAQLPAQCESCGYFGSVANLIGGSASNVTIADVRAVGACPQCGGDMKVVDGVYDLEDNVVSAFRHIGEDRLRSLRDTLRASQKGDITPEAATAEVAAISPEVAAIIEAFQNQKQWTSPVIVSTLLGIIAVLLAWLALNPDKTLTDADHEELQHDVREAIEQVQPPPPAGGGAASKSPSRRPAPQTSSRKPKRKKRPPKTYGKTKHKKRR